MKVRSGKKGKEEEEEEEGEEIKREVNGEKRRLETGPILENPPRILKMEKGCL